MPGEEAAAGRVGNDAPASVAAAIVKDPVNAVDKASRRDVKSGISLSLAVYGSDLLELMLLWA